MKLYFLKDENLKSHNKIRKKIYFYYFSFEMGIQKLIEGLRIYLKFYYYIYVGICTFTHLYSISNIEENIHRVRCTHNDDPRMFVLYSAFPRSKDDVLVVITQDESACRARELCTVPFSFQRCIMRTFYRGLLCFFHLSSVRFMIHRRGYKDIFFDISIRRMEHVHTRVLLKKYCPCQCLTSKLIKNIIYFTIYKIVSIFDVCNIIFYVENKEPTLRIS